MEVGSIIETTEAKKIRYEAKYLGPWVGCGGEVDVPCGVKFRVVEVNADMDMYRAKDGFYKAQRKLQH